MDPIVLANANLRMEFSPETGALIGLHALKTGWSILDRPQLGLSFRLLVPLSEELRNNPVFGEKQPLVSHQVSPDGRSALFAWGPLQSERGGQLDIHIQLRVSLDEEQAVYAIRVENRSRFVVENVYCPYLGDIRPPAQAGWMKSFLYSYASATEWNLWPSFDNTRGYFGFDRPIQFNGAPFSGTPMSPYILLRSADQGLYVGAVSNSTEYVAWNLELYPGYGESINHRVPTELTVGGKDVSIRFAAIHLPYIQPGETRELTPIALQPFQGSWHAGVDIYKRWRDSWFVQPELPTWAAEPHSWQQLHINSPEDELRLPFRELVHVAEECARNGVKAIQLVGWNDGGQDQGNPSHSPDPRLGTFEELKEAIHQAQALGVKIVLFSKFTWADRATRWFREELEPLAIKDPYGDYYLHPGYQYQTATQGLDINTKRLIPMCFLTEAYLEVCRKEFAKIVELGADGILFDECLHHGPAVLCFDPAHAHRSAAPVYANDREFIRRFHKVSDPVKPDFLFAGEACYDWEMDTYQLSYHRSESKTHIPLSKYMLPPGLFMTAATGFEDRGMINQCLMYGYIISYEPYNFKGHLEDYPLTLAYGKQMEQLREELRGWFWDGEFRDTQGAQVTRDGAPHAPYGVFLHAETRLPGVVVCNYDEKEAIRVQVQADGANLSRWRLVDNPSWKPLEAGILIPPRSAAVVI